MTPKPQNQYVSKYVPAFFMVVLLARLGWFWVGSLGFVATPLLIDDESTLPGVVHFLKMQATEFLLPPGDECMSKHITRERLRFGLIFACLPALLIMALIADR